MFPTSAADRHTDKFIGTSLDVTHTQLYAGTRFMIGVGHEVTICGGYEVDDDDDVVVVVVVALTLPRCCIDVAMILLKCCQMVFLIRFST